MKLFFAVSFLFLAGPVSAAPPAHRLTTSPIVHRLPLPLRQLLYKKFQAAIERAAEEGDAKYPLPNSQGGPYQKVSLTEYAKYQDIQTRYVNKLTERYTSRIRRQYGVSSHEEESIEYEGAELQWPN